MAMAVASTPNSHAQLQVQLTDSSTSTLMKCGNSAIWLQTATQANSAANMAISAAGTAVTGGPNPSSPHPVGQGRWRRDQGG